ncbi:putative Ig domain-containing protein [Edaphobacter paludis]|uniref:Ig domain-containing protein n=1 Tax=Edaphobacter paludis TaxID=3035702 RepID=A0AAU7DCG8_9BACT
MSWLIARLWVLGGLVLSLDRSMASFFGLFRSPFRPGRMVRATLTVAVALMLLALADRQLAAQTVTSSLPVGTTPSAVAVNPVTNQIYIANYASDTATMINGATNTTATMTVGSEPDAVAVNSVTNQIYVANKGSNTVTVIDGGTNTVSTTVPVGSNPGALGVNPITNQIYVANYGDGTVTVIDGSTNTMSATVTVGSNPYAVAVNPVTNRVYIPNNTISGTVSVINGATGSVVATVPVGGNPDAVAVNPVTNQVYVANNTGNSVTVIDGTTNNTATVTVGSSPDAVAANPVTNQVYVANNTSASVTVINGATNSVTTMVSVKSNPAAVAVNSVTNQVYIANKGNGTVSVINGATNSVAATVTVGTTPYAVAVNPVTNQAYVINNGSNTVTVISGASNPTTTVTVGTTPYAVAVNPVTNQAYVANYASGTVTAINGATNMATTITVGSAPNAVAVNPVTNQVYVTNSGGNTVSVINGATNTVAATVTLGSGSAPYAIAVNPVTNQVYVANNATSGTVSVIDGATNTLTATLTVGSQPDAVAVNPVTNQVYVANNTGTVSVIDGVTNSTTTLTVVGNPHAVAVNSVTNQVYVANLSNTLSVIDGATNTLVSTVTVGSNPYAVAVNPVTNHIYVANLTSNTVSVIDGVSNTITATIGVGSQPDALAVNPVTDRIYVANSGGSKVTVIDGASNTNTGVTVKANPFALAVNPLTNQVYVANYGNASVSVINVDGTGGQQTVPITVSTTPPATDPLTVALPNTSIGTPFITMNPAPTLTATVTGAYTTSSTYSSDTTQTPGNPPPTALYYQVDGGSGLWSQATVSSATASNPATFNLPLTGQPAGVHTLYLYAAYGNEGVPDSTGQGTGNSPEISNVTGFTYVVVPVLTTTTLKADENPQEPGDNVTFTVTVSSSSGTTVPSGTVSFYDSISGTPVLLGTANLAEGSGSDQADFKTSFTATGSHPITSVYEGDANHAGSIGSLTEIIDTLTLTPTTLSSAMVGTLYSETLGASGGDSSATYTYALSSGSLPAGLVLSASGAISGTPTAAGSFSFTLTATDSSNSSLTGSQAYALTVAAPTISLMPVSGTLNATAEMAYSQTFTASGGTSPYIYSISTGVLPAGLSLNGTTGAISGTPTASGTFSFTVRAVDSSTGTGSPFFTANNYTLVMAAPTIILIPASLPSPMVETAYGQTISTTGGTSPYTYSISAGALPAGLTLSSTTGVISGTATAGGAFSFTVTAKDANNFTATQAYSFTIAAPTITLTPTTLPSPTIEKAYSQIVSATGGASPYTYSISAGALPSGLTLSSPTGGISGTATASGTFSFTVTTKDTNNFTATQTYSFTINAPTITLTPITLPSPTVGVAYSQAVSANGGIAPYTYTISAGALPMGLTLSSTTGVISGTETAANTSSFTVKAKDSDGFTATQTYSITVARQASQTTVSASSLVATPAQTVTLTATVSATVAGTSVMPTGTVTFLDNGTQVGTAALSGGTATLVAPSLPAGATAVITGTYAGDGDFLASTSSNSATVVVSAFDFTFTNTGAAAYTADSGAVASYNFALAPLYGSYGGNVSFNVTGLPAGATASFTPSTVAVGGGAAPVVMTVHTAAAIAQNHDHPLGRSIVLALLFLPLLSKRRVREKLKGRMLLMVLLMAGLTATLTGCGSGGVFEMRPPQTYTLVVTAANGTLQHTQTVTLTVDYIPRS